MTALTIKEVWRDIPEFEGYYQVSNLGRVKSLIGWNGRKYINRERIIKPTLTSTGYYKVDLKKNGKRKVYKLHRAIAQAFIPNPERKPFINHIDGNPLNNDIANLEWCTNQENIRHGYKLGLIPSTKEHHDDFVHRYAEGKTIREIAEEYGVSCSAVGNAIKNRGVSIRASMSYRDKYHIPLDVLYEMFDRGMSNKQIAAIYGCSNNLIGVRRYQRKRAEI